MKPTPKSRKGEARALVLFTDASREMSYAKPFGSFTRPLVQIYHPTKSSPLRASRWHNLGWLEKRGRIATAITSSLLPGMTTDNPCYPGAHVRSIAIADAILRLME